MLKVRFENWHESVSKLREEALKAEHPRTLERLMAIVPLFTKGSIRGYALK